MRKKTKSPKRSGYWKLYHASKLNDYIKTYKLIVEIVEELGEPWRTSKRGKPPKFLPTEHACLVVFMKAFDKTYREIEGICPHFS